MEENPYYYSLRFLLTAGLLFVSQNSGLSGSSLMKGLQLFLRMAFQEQSKEKE